MTFQMNASVCTAPASLTEKHYYFMTFLHDFPGSSHQALHLLGKDNHSTEQRLL
jgi:hypothetical protein